MCCVVLCYMCCVVLCCVICVVICVVSCRVVSCCVVLFTCKANCSSHSFMALLSLGCTVKKFSKSVLSWCIEREVALARTRFSWDVDFSSIFEQKQQYFVEIRITFLLPHIFYQNFLPSIRLSCGNSKRTCPKLEALCKTICTCKLKCSRSTGGAENVLKFDYFWIID